MRPYVRTNSPPLLGVAPSIVIPAGRLKCPFSQSRPAGRALRPSRRRHAFRAAPGARLSRSGPQARTRPSRAEARSPILWSGALGGLGAGGGFHQAREFKDSMSSLSTAASFCASATCGETATSPKRLFSPGAGMNRSTWFEGMAACLRRTMVRI